MKPLIIGCCIVALSACQTVPTRNKDYAHQRIGPGSLLVLEKPLKVPAQGTSVHIQRGQPVPANGIDELSPHCIFQLWTRGEDSRRIEPDSFLVTKVRWGVRHSALGAPVLVASGRGDITGDSPTQLFYDTEFFLRSDTQTDVYLLTCRIDQMHAGGHAFASYLTVADVQDALNGLFRLDPRRI